MFIGYASGKKRYKCYNPTIRKFVVSMDVTFLENQKFFLQGESSSNSSSTEEGNFWDIIANLLPSVVLETEPTEQK